MGGPTVHYRVRTPSGNEAAGHFQASGLEFGYTLARTLSACLPVCSDVLCFVFYSVLSARQIATGVPVICNDTVMCVENISVEVVSEIFGSICGRKWL